MIIDLFSPASYLIVNKDAIRLLGLNTAVYCSELSTIYKKVVTKKKFVNDENYFEVDRDYITKQTCLTTDEQLKCDLNLQNVNIIKIDNLNPNVIYFDVEMFASYLASQDIKLLNEVSKSAKNNSKFKKEEQKETRTKMIVQRLKESIDCNTPEVIAKMCDWIDTIYASGKVLSKAQVNLFLDKLNNYCNGDLNLAMKILNSAITHAYIDCQWAINSYKKDIEIESSTTLTTGRASLVRRTEQKKTTEVSEESF